MRPRTVLNAALLALLIIGSFRPFLLRLVLPPHRMPNVAGPENGLDRKPLRLRSDGTPEELRLFLVSAALATPRGHSVAVVLPPPFDGWSYSYWRATYELAGRDVTLPGNADAEFVAAWHSDWSNPSYEPVWMGFGGAVFKRR
ncbi:MAG TPA: hypothetical protein VLU46_07855 [Thermoanaerobaculia bacterium]|nr:hypothetical protein [Thermoanaerobaculia bacterium]